MNQTNEKDGTNEVAESQFRNYVNKKWALVAFLFALPLYWFFDHRGDPGRAMAGGGAVVMILLTVRYRWDLRKRTWFWATVTFLVLLHVLLLLLFPWPDTNLPGIALLPYGMLDIGIMYGCIRLVENVANRNRIARTRSGKDGAKAAMREALDKPPSGNPKADAHDPRRIEIERLKAELDRKSRILAEVVEESKKTGYNSDENQRR